MPRKGGISRREVELDPRYANYDENTRQLIARFINLVMREGKKAIAEKIVYGALERAAERTKEEEIKVLQDALANVQPKVEVKSRRVGGATYQVPIDVRADRSQALGMRWLILYARQRREKTMVEKLAAELLDAAKNVGGAVKKREDTHRMAEANRAFAHYKW